MRLAKKSSPRCYRCGATLLSRSGAELPEDAICRPCADASPWLTYPVFERASTVRRAA